MLFPQELQTSALLFSAMTDDSLMTDDYVSTVHLSATQSNFNSTKSYLGLYTDSYCPAVFLRLLSTLNTLKTVCLSTKQ